ncbi:MAG: ComEC/Rec2 family competence protein, partial [Fidelibacterota bacterium]
DRNYIPGHIKNDFSSTGVIHVLAVSGLHVGYVVVILFGISGFFRLGFSFRILFTIAGIFLYAVLTGLKPSVTRASLMASFTLGSFLLEKKVNVYNTLGLAGLLILVFRPEQLFDLGFQLSFLAVFSIIHFFERLKNLLPSAVKKGFKNRFFNGLFSLFLVSLAAQMGTLPLTAYYFKRIPLISLAANLVVVPLVGIIVALGFTMLLFNLISLSIASVFAQATAFMLFSLKKIVHYAGALPFSYYEFVGFNIAFSIFYYIFILIFTEIKNKNSLKYLVIFLMIISNFTLWKRLYRSEKLKITFISVRKGNAVLIETPGGKRVMIDGGGKSRFFDAGKYVILPFLKSRGIKEIDHVFILSPYIYSIGGLEHILENFKVLKVHRSKLEYSSKTYVNLTNSIDRRRIPLIHPAAGSVIWIDDDFRAWVMSSPEAGFNRWGKSIDGSLLLKFFYGKSSFLIGGDFGKNLNLIADVYGNLLKSDLVKIHLNKVEGESLEKIFDVLKPQYAVISFRNRNLY